MAAHRLSGRTGRALRRCGARGAAVPAEGPVVEFRLRIGRPGGRMASGATPGGGTAARPPG